MLQNRWLDQYARTLDPKGAATLAQARGMRAKEKQSQIMGGANAVHLNDPWGQFDDFHKVRAIEEGLEGNRYKVGTIQGGGDLNQRPLNGAGVSRQINAPTTRAAAPRATALTAPRGVTGGDDMYEFLSQRPVTAERAGVQDLVMRALRAQVAQQEAAGDVATRNANPQMAEGTPNWYNAQRQRSGLEDDLREDTMVSNARGAANAYEQYGRGHATMQATDRAVTEADIFRNPAVSAARGVAAGEAESVARRDHQRLLERGMVNALPTWMASQNRLTQTGMTADQRTVTAQIAALRAEIGNARQYGDTERVAALTPQLDAMLALEAQAPRPGVNTAAPAPGRAQGPGPRAGAGAPGATPPRPPNAPPNAYYDPNGPDGPGWYVDE
jgi:hypothetical protein